MEVKIIPYSSDKGASEWDQAFSVGEAKRALEFHRGFAEYEPTPLRSLSGLAARLGLSGFYVKDESRRFGLNAFKGLGGSYALAKLMAEKSGRSQERLSAEALSGIPANTYTFVTATDGNHGRGIAWAAKRLSQRAVVYMPKGSARERLENIRSLGASAEITEYNYDDTVRFARDQAERMGGILVQDTAWEGYETIPVWIMQGYMTMALEAAEQLGKTIPTHLFLQAGVGAMAGAVAGFFRSLYGERMPRLILVEPDRADCLYQTAQAADGKLHRVTGALDSIMAGLCCGEVCTVGWEVLRHQADYFASCPDDIAADGMRLLGNPEGGDSRVISGESGAVTSGLVYRLMRDEALSDWRRSLGLDQNSVVLCFSTEGDTDRENYRRVVWEGWYPSRSWRAQTERSKTT